MAKDQWKENWADLTFLRNEEETGIKHMFYDWNDEMETIRKIQKCQRKRVGGGEAAS